jgi:hypothetical protein
METMASVVPTATHIVVLGHEIAAIAGAAVGTASAVKLVPPSVDRSSSAPPAWVVPAATQTCTVVHVTPVRCPPAGDGVTVGGVAAGGRAKLTVAAPTTKAEEDESPLTLERTNAASPKASSIGFSAVPP